MIRIVIVDDSSVVRRALSECLKNAEDFEVVETATNGEAAIHRVGTTKPDILLIDQEMPIMDGLTAMKVLQKKAPDLRVVMLAQLGEANPDLVAQAMAAGAADFIAKPRASDRVDFEQFVNQIVLPKLRALAPKAKLAEEKIKSIPPPPSVSNDRQISFDLIVLGTSTGGPGALATVLPGLAQELKVPLLIVQHMPKEFTGSLAKRLSEQTGLELVEGETGRYIDEARAWLAPGDYHMIIEKGARCPKLVLTQTDPLNSCRPAVDALFLSAAQVCKSRTLVVMLTGMGQDGLIGTQALREAGAYVIAQDEASSVVWGMPGAIAEAGLVDELIPLSKVADRILELQRGSRAADRHRVHGGAA